jgi:aminoglycoside 3-N-acetyltransferase
MDFDGAHLSTRASLSSDLRRLGVLEGDILLVHSSLRSCGYVVGGVIAAVLALKDAVGPTGTIVVPTPTPDNSDPSRWKLTIKEPVPPQWWPQIRDHLPAFDPASTPSRNAGVIAEAVRGWPGAIRSNHPQTSFAALGPEAAQLMRVHDRDCHLGEASPLGSLFRTRAKILLLGVGYDVCTAFHLAEYRLPQNPQRDYECVITENGRPRWYHYRDVELSDADFGAVGRALEAAPEGGRVSHGPVGDSRSRLLPLAAAVDFAGEWFARHRS